MRFWTIWFPTSSHFLVTHTLKVGWPSYISTKHHNFSVMSRQFPKFLWKQFPNTSRHVLSGTRKSSRSRLEFRDLEKLGQFLHIREIRDEKRKKERKKNKQTKERKKERRKEKKEKKIRKRKKRKKRRIRKKDTDRWTDRQTDGHTEGQMDRLTDQILGFPKLWWEQISKNKFLVSKFGMKILSFPFPYPKTGTGKLRSLISTKLEHSPQEINHHIKANIRT
jgi:hypothetical protein